LITINSQIELAMTVCPYEHLDFRTYKSYKVETKHTDSRDIDMTHVATPNLTLLSLAEVPNCPIIEELD